MAVAGLVLAAGSGSRLGEPKALVMLDGRRLVDRAVAVLRAGGCDVVVVVSGAAPFEVDGAVVLDNPEWETGMGSSLRAGLAELAKAAVDSDAVVVAMVDTPGVTPEVVRRIAAGDAPVVVATYGGRRGNPVRLARSIWDEVARLAVGDIGARGYLAAHPDQVLECECGGVGDGADIDTARDLAQARAAASATDQGRDE
ncbi:MAG: nucleotidyltransferase family protein [Sporichthyaceae bacterium]